MSSAQFLNKLLDGAEVEWLSLGEAVNLKRGRRLVKKELQPVGKYAVYQNSMKPLGYYHKSNVKSDTAFIICAGAAGEIGFSDQEFWAADDVYVCLNSDDIIGKYIYYFLLNQQSKIKSRVRRASIPRLSKLSFEKILIPVPCPDNLKKSLAIQREIVRILDSLTELTAGLTAELKAELILREKQVTYYRSQLLNFPKSDKGVK